MKVLFDHASPFLLAHGGLQIQIEQTKRALEDVAVTVDYLRWWDPAQTGDLIHYFGRPNAAYIRFAHGKGIPVVITDLLTGLGSRSSRARLAQQIAIRTARSTLPASLWNRMAWDAYAEVDCAIALTGWEAKLMHEIFQAPRDRVSVVPNGVEDLFFQEHRSAERGPELVCSATITERKRVLELAMAAVRSGVPIRIIGQPYDVRDDYAVRFAKLAEQFPKIVRYQGAIRNRSELARVYREARGFVLLSTMESLSLSALEAAASGCPLLLSDLPWARTVFGAGAQYCPVAGEMETARVLKRFHEEAPNLPLPSKPLSWTTVAQRLRDIYQRILA